MNLRVNHKVDSKQTHGLPHAGPDNMALALTLHGTLWLTVRGWVLGYVVRELAGRWVAGGWPFYSCVPAPSGKMCSIF